MKPVLASSVAPILAPVLSPITHVLATIATIFTPVDPVLDAVEDAAVVPSIAPVLAPIAHVFAPISSILAPVEYILEAVYPPPLPRLPRMGSSIRTGDGRNRHDERSYESLDNPGHLLPPSQALTSFDRRVRRRV